LFNLLDPKAAAESRKKFEAEIDGRVEKKLKEGVAHKVLNIINPRHDAEIGLSMFIAQAGQYSIQAHEEKTIDNLLSAARTVSSLSNSSSSTAQDLCTNPSSQLEAAGGLHDEIAKNAVTAVAELATDSFDAQLARIEKLESILAIAKEKIIADKAIHDKQVEEQRAAAEFEASRVAKRKRREEGAAGFAVRDAMLAEEAAAENGNGTGSSSEAPVQASSDAEEVVKGRSKRQRRI
jgi:hypothetical protein